MHEQSVDYRVSQWMWLIGLSTGWLKKKKKTPKNIRWYFSTRRKGWVFQSNNQTQVWLFFFSKTYQCWLENNWQDSALLFQMKLFYSPGSQFMKNLTNSLILFLVTKCRWQVIISHAWTGHLLLSTSHMSHITSNLYINICSSS